MKFIEHCSNDSFERTLLLPYILVHKLRNFGHILGSLIGGVSLLSGQAEFWAEICEHEWNQGQRCLLVNNVFSYIQFYCYTKEVSKPNRVTHFKTNFYEFSPVLLVKYYWVQQRLYGTAY